MLKARKKIRQKEIKKDKLVTFYFQAKETLGKQEIKKRIYTSLGILAVIIIIIFFYVNNKRAKSEEAEVKLSAIINLYEAAKYQEAINGDPASGTSGLLEIVNNYGSTESGETAKMYLGNCFYFIKDYDNALKYFEDYSGSNNIIKASVISGIGAVYEAKGDLKRAGENYEKSASIDKNVIINQENLFYAIRAYSMAGDKENAKRIYDILRNDYPKSKYLAETKRFEADFKN
jgi:outer membrane protein assembly factor BamD (BamD/ComL family)